MEYLDGKKEIQVGDKDHKKDWSCSVCGKEFRYPYTLLRHMPIHTKERKYKCDKCPKAFRQMSTLSQHKATHSSEKPHKCEVCGKAFNRGSTLISHKRTHQKVKRFACSICRKAFHQKGNLVNHIYTHTNQRPYTCNICSRGFNQKSNLVCHMFTLHGKKKLHSCEFCPASFSRENAYLEHINGYHQLGAMPVVENDKFHYSPANLLLNPDNETLKKSISNNLVDLQPAMGEAIPRKDMKSFSITSNNTSFRVDPNRSNIRVNVLKSPKKPTLKIPALPIFSNCDIEADTVNETVIMSQRFLGNPSLGIEVTDVIISDMGRNIVIRGKPPSVLEETKSKGQIAFLLVVEPEQSPKLCKASLGTEGFIVSPVTIMDIDLLIPDSKQLFISIVMTIKRILKPNGDVKTHLFVHHQPILLNISQDYSGYLNCYIVDHDITDAGPLCIKVSSPRSNATSNGILTLKSDAFEKKKEFPRLYRQTEMKPVESYSESENIIRLHLSQVGESEEHNKENQPNLIKPEFIENCSFIEIKNQYLIPDQSF